MTPGHRRHGHSRNIVHRDARSRKEVVELGHEAISLCVEPYAGIDRCKRSEVTSCGIQPLSSSSSISNQISIPRESLPRSTPLVDCNLPRRPRRSTTRLPRVSATRAPSETRVPTTKQAAPLITSGRPESSRGSGFSNPRAVTGTLGSGRAISSKDDANDSCVITSAAKTTTGIASDAMPVRDPNASRTQAPHAAPSSASMTTTTNAHVSTATRKSRADVMTRQSSSESVSALASRSLLE
mmetsp:Transcript_27596/g.93927  ORF Transcript_27596/g.93927 Transcript_27596/m.93927 type:complete len:240 (-) Transcript_27596:420-1139(-)